MHTIAAGGGECQSQNDASQRFSSLKSFFFELGEASKDYSSDVLEGKSRFANGMILVKYRYFTVSVNLTVLQKH